MRFQGIESDSSLSPFVKSIMVFECDKRNTETTLPFFADGFPGLVYHETPSGLYVTPHEKRMPAFFIYGQTIEPIKMKTSGNFQMIVFQLYPFTLKSLFGINAQSLNDNCYDLTHRSALLQIELSANSNVHHSVKSVSNFIIDVIDNKKSNFDNAIFQAIEKILNAKGKLSLLETSKEVNLTKRTFERRFLSETGLTPKQFAKIIQFQNSLTQLSVNDYNILADVVYKNGYADQSHFIRVFKSFTGKTPKQFTTEQGEN